MFPDSAITETFSLGKDKDYLIIYVIFLVFKQKLKSIINDSHGFQYHLMKVSAEINRNARWM